MFPLSRLAPAAIASRCAATLSVLYSPVFLKRVNHRAATLRPRQRDKDDVIIAMRVRGADEKRGKRGAEWKKGKTAKLAGRVGRVLEATVAKTKQDFLKRHGFPWKGKRREIGWIFSAASLLARSSAPRRVLLSYRTIRR